MPVFVQVSRITGVQPAILQRPGRRLGILVIPQEDALPANQDLADVREADVGAGRGFTYGLPSHLAIEVQDTDARSLRLAVDLFEIEPDRSEKFKDLRAQWRAAGVGIAQTRHSKLILQAAKGEHVSQCSKQSPA